MTVFLSGGAKSGKSAFAQDLAVKLSRGGARYYVATMIPVDAEDWERVRRHVADRAGMGFQTLECGTAILQCLDMGDRGGTFLVDSATALLQNAMFPRENNYELDLSAACRCGEELAEFVRKAENAVIVSDYIYGEPKRYDPATETYRRMLAQIDRMLARECDTVLEASAGRIIVHKGEKPI